MNDLFVVCFSLSLSGSLVAFVLILLKPLLRRFGKAWQYYAWLLVILRLLIPFSPSESIVGNLFQQAEIYDIQQQESTGYISESNGLEIAEPSTASSHEHAELQEAPAVTMMYDSIKNHIWGVLWLLVTMVLLMRKIIGYNQFLRAVQKQSKQITDAQLLTVFHTVCTTMGIKKKFSIYSNPLIRSPMLIGIIRPGIVLPTSSMLIPKLMLVFRHELTHYRRKDIIYKWLVEIAVCLHWFNPLVYWVRKQMNQDCEFSCDESVVLHLAHSERKIYGETLLDSIVVNSVGRSGPVSLFLNKDSRLIKERLNSVMLYQKKSKGIIFLAIVLTTVLFCGSIFVGAHSVAAAEITKTASSNNPIRISGSIASGGKISLGSQFLESGMECQVLLTWTGTSKLTILCTASSGSEKLYSVENGKVTSFLIDSSGEYTVAVKNTTTKKIGSISGTITFHQKAKNQQSENTNSIAPIARTSKQSIIYNLVEMRRYEGEDGHPYIHDTKTNGTNKVISGYQYGMLAFDKKGNPLKINWWCLDTEAESTYFYLEEAFTKILPAETYDVRGGWSLNCYGDDPEVEQIAYVLYCDKEITFEDGTKWVNPNFENWRTSYEGKKVKVDILKNYYPYEQKITE